VTKSKHGTSRLEAYISVQDEWSTMLLAIKTMVDSIRITQ